MARFDAEGTRVITTVAEKMHAELAKEFFMQGYLRNDSDEDQIPRLMVEAIALADAVVSAYLKGPSNE